MQREYFFRLKLILNLSQALIFFLLIRSVEWKVNFFLLFKIEL